MTRKSLVSQGTIDKKGALPAPVRVRLKKITVMQAQAFPPDGQGREWWNRLKNALGTPSSDFVNASLSQLIAAARLPLGGISEVAVNAALAFIEGGQPREEVECALGIQMACTHTAVMAVLASFVGSHGSGRNGAMMAKVQPAVFIFSRSRSPDRTD